MAYSNTNKDKRQLSRWKWVKQGIFYIVVTYLLVTSLSNIYRQMTTLRSGVKRVDDLEKRTLEIEREKWRYKLLVEEATSSSTLMRKQHEYLELGGENDYWLVVPTISSERMVNEVNEVETKPNIIKWWDLFTK